jgi:hypothetical protein
MRTDHLDELGDTVFVVAMGGAIGLGAANLAVQVNKERAAFDAAVIGRAAGLTITPPLGDITPLDMQRIRSGQPAGQLNY